MEVGPGTEALAQLYVDEPFQALALDLWDGTAAQCELYRDLTGVTYPVLMQAGTAQLGEMYDCMQTSFFVVDGAGVIRYRNAYEPENWPNWHPDEVAAAVDEALAGLNAVAVPEIGQADPWLVAPYPNPGNPQVTLVIELPGTAEVSVEILDLRGRRIRSVLSSTMAAGRHEMRWDGMDDWGRGAPSGTYLVWLRAGGHEEGRFLNLVR